MGYFSPVAAFYDPEEAYCAQSYLRAHGVDTIIQNDHHLTAAPWLRIALGGFRLLARHDFEAEAKSLLSAVDVYESVPESGSKPLEQKWFWAPIAFALAIPFLPNAKSGWKQGLQIGALITLYVALLLVWTL